MHAPLWPHTSPALHGEPDAHTFVAPHATSTAWGELLDARTFVAPYVTSSALGATSLIDERFTMIPLFLHGDMVSISVCIGMRDTLTSQPFLVVPCMSSTNKKKEARSS